MSSTPDRGGGTPTRTVSSHRIRVVTVPSWARNLPPEFPDDDDDDEPRVSLGKRPTDARNRSLSSVFRPPPTTPAGAPLGPHDANSEASTSSSPSPTNPPSANPRPPPQAAFHTSDFQRQSTHPGPGGGDKWWTFTIPGKYLDKVHDYVQANSSSTGDDPERGKDKGSGSGDEGRRRSRLGRGEKESMEKDETPRHHHHHHAMTMSARLPGTSNVFSMNQTQTPGWSSPWQPFHRASGDFSDAFHFQPETPGPMTRYVRFQEFLLNNVFAPLVFRIGNLVLVTCTLALATRIRVQENRANLIGVMGSSTVTAICVCPLALVHVFVNVYIEYFGRPIGLWEIRTKMLHTLTELVFICLFASTLSLCFDDLFTSPLSCTAWNPYARFSLTPIDAGSSKVEGTLADRICSEQIALVVFVFWSLGLYVAVLVVSLFRIFARVKR